MSTGYGFREWNYATRMVSFSETENIFYTESRSFDSGTGITIVDGKFVQRQAESKISICLMAIPITIWEISTTQNTIDEYAIVPCLFESMHKKEEFLANFWEEVHFLIHLKANLPIDIDVIGPKLLVVDMKQKRVILGSYDVEVFIKIKFCSDFDHGITYRVHVQKTTLISSHSISPVCLHYFDKIWADQNNLFVYGDVYFGVILIW